MSTRGLVIAIAALVACDRSAPREPAPAPVASQSAYVWQRHWTPGVREAVARPPAGIDGLRVLIAEASSSGMTTMAVDAHSLASAGVPIILVLRVEGSRPIEAVSIDPIVGVADRLRERGVDVVGIEIDHDCATARLAEYARWLEERRPRGYRFSITALPTWASSAALGSVARAVDEIVVQVHAVRAPVIFDANIAWRDLTRFARAVDVPVRVALPTYSAVVRDVEVSVDPADVGAFVARLKTAPALGVGGIVWFRLPVGGDEQTWSRATFARVVGDAARGGAGRDGVVPAARVELVARGEQRFDVVVSNASDALVDMPAVRVAGDIGAADMVMGYRESGPGRWDAPRRSLARDERVVVGWIHGKDLSLVD